MQPDYFLITLRYNSPLDQRLIFECKGMVPSNKLMGAPSYVHIIFLDVSIDLQLVYSDSLMVCLFLFVLGFSSPLIWRGHIR